MELLHYPQFFNSLMQKHAAFVSTSYFFLLLFLIISKPYSISTYGKNKNKLNIYSLELVETLSESCAAYLTNKITTGQFVMYTKKIYDNFELKNVRT